ncbi:hypothetical protein [Sorangium cellulosum]|uniref:hypothetical protein n=1 Tax=Sorangium cellulosum TaxID=56 RepID=UPI0012DB57DE|nr:hypothetical protein [Sorangium cellulosum]
MAQKKAGPAKNARPPHPATVAQKKAVPTTPARPPHPAAVAQRMTIQRSAERNPSDVPSLTTLGILEDEQVQRWLYYSKGKKLPENKVKGLIAEYLTKHKLTAVYRPEKHVCLTGVKVSLATEGGWNDIAEIDVLVGVVDDGKLVPVLIAEAKAGKYGAGKYTTALSKKLKAMELVRTNEALLTTDYPIARILEEEGEVTMDDLRQRELIAYKKRFQNKLAVIAAGPEGKDLPLAPKDIDAIYQAFTTWWSQQH